MPFRSTTASSRLPPFADEGGGAAAGVRLQKGDAVGAGQTVAQLLVRHQDQPQRTGHARRLQRGHRQQRDGDAALAVHDPGAVKAALGRRLQKVREAARGMNGVQMSHEADRRLRGVLPTGDGQRLSGARKGVRFDGKPQRSGEVRRQIGGARNVLPIGRKALLRGQTLQKRLKAGRPRFDIGKKCRYTVQRNPSFRNGLIVPAASAPRYAAAGGR